MSFSGKSLLLLLGILLSALNTSAFVRLEPPRMSLIELGEVDGEWLEAGVVLRGYPEPPGPFTLRLEAVFSSSKGPPVRFTGQAHLNGLFRKDRRLLLYLHPEVVAHHGIRDDPLAWQVSATSADKPPVELRSESGARLLREAVNAGAFLLIFDTPFHSENYPEKLEKLPATRPKD